MINQCWSISWLPTCSNLPYDVELWERQKRHVVDGSPEWRQVTIFCAVDEPSNLNTPSYHIFYQKSLNISSYFDFWLLVSSLSSSIIGVDDVNYLSNPSSQSSPYTFGLNGAGIYVIYRFTSFFSILPISRSLNQGWANTSSTSFLYPNLYSGFLTSIFEMKSLPYFDRLTFSLNFS